MVPTKLNKVAKQMIPYIIRLSDLAVVSSNEVVKSPRQIPTHFIPGADGNLSLLIVGVVGVNGEFFIIPKMGNRPFSRRVGPTPVKSTRSSSTPGSERSPDSRTCCGWSI